MDVFQYAHADVASDDYDVQKHFCIYHMSKGVHQYAHVDVASDYREQ
jgi:hypothetical protein